MALFGETGRRLSHNGPWGKPEETVYQHPKGMRIPFKITTNGSLWGDLRKYVVAPLPAILIVAGGIFLLLLGFKKTQIGGLLGKLTGNAKNPDVKAVDVANTIPTDRVDDKGVLIPVGTPDSKGITQAVVVPIQEPGLFDDPKIVKVTDPSTGETKSVQVPDGVSAKDVEKVIIVSPEVHVVSVNNKSKVSASNVDDLMAKYGKK